MLMNNLAFTDLIAKQLNVDAQRKFEDTRIVRDLNSVNKVSSSRLLLRSFWQDILGLILTKRDAKVTLSSVKTV